MTADIIKVATWQQIATAEVPGDRGTPPLYFLLLKGWCALFGTSELSLRFPSALLGTAAVVLIFLVGRELVSREVGGGSAILLALNPMHVAYSRDARFYPLFVVLVLINALLFVRVMSRSSRTGAILYAVSLALLVYAHLYAVFFLLFEAIWMARAWFKGQNIQGGVVGLALGGLLLMPFGVVLGLDFGSRVNEELSWLVQTRLSAPLRVYPRILGPPLFPVLLVLAGLALSEPSETVLFLLGWATIPVIAVYITSLLYRPLFHPKYLFSVLPALVILAAVGMARAKALDRRLFALAVCYIAIIGGPVQFRRTLAHHRTIPWRIIRATFDNRKLADEPILIQDAWVKSLAYYADPTTQIVELHCNDQPLEGVPELSSFWFVEISRRPCQAELLEALRLRYQPVERIDVGGAAVVHFMTPDSHVD